METLHSDMLKSGRNVSLGSLKDSELKVVGSLPRRSTMFKVLVLGLCSSFALGWPLTKPKNANPVPTTVDLGYARYQGVSLDAGIKQWLGIRYAASPVGDLRWRAPGDPVSNSTIQVADAVSVCSG